MEMDKYRGKMANMLGDLKNYKVFENPFLVVLDKVFCVIKKFF